MRNGQDRSLRSYNKIIVYLVGNMPACSVFNGTAEVDGHSGMGRPIPYKTDSSVFVNVGLRRASAANAANNNIAQKLCHSEHSEESPQLL